MKSIIFLVLAFACSEGSRWGNESHVASLSLPGTIDRSASVLAKDLKHRNFASLSAFIEQLPAIYKIQTVLMTKSRSRHLASQEHPRIIMFNDPVYSSTFTIIAASTHPQDKNFEHIEVIEFDRQQSRYNFHNLVLRNGTFETLETNPPLCQGCHGMPLRPNWEPYPFWPGAIGAREGLSINDKDLLRHIATSALAENAESARRLRSLSLEETIVASRYVSPAFALSTAIHSNHQAFVVHNLKQRVEQGALDPYAVMAAILDCDDFFTQGSRKVPDVQLWRELETSSNDMLRKLDPVHRSLWDASGWHSLKSMQNLRYLLGGNHEDRFLTTSFTTPYLLEATNNRITQLAMKWCWTFPELESVYPLEVPGAGGSAGSLACFFSNIGSAKEQDIVDSMCTSMQQ